MYSSPVKKSLITINGRNFGTDESLVNVYLLEKGTLNVKYDLIL